MAEEKTADATEGPPRPRPFWSGILAFGLVSVPVDLYSAVRRSRASLRMVAADGTPLSRRYVCSLEDVPVEQDEIVRGYEIESGEFVLVGDEELEGLAPDKSREIDLRRFVPRDQIDPSRFDRAYVLAPAGESTKAYRLLARAMEDSGRAGVATFVMRGKEYLVAILARGGLLLAETLRFDDELRTPADVGLGAPAEPDEARAKELEAALRGLEAEGLDRDELADRGSHRLRNLVEAKLESGEDVFTPSGRAEDEDDDEAPLDLMEVLKRSLEEGDPTGAAGDGHGRGGKRRRNGGRGGGGRSREGGGKAPRRGGGDAGRGRDLAQSTKAELYERAKERGIEGRSSMTKAELIDAIRG